MKKIFYTGACAFAFLGLSALQVDANDILMHEKLKGQDKLRIADMIQEELSDEGRNLEVVVYDENENVIVYDVVNANEPIFTDFSQLEDNSEYTLEVSGIDE